MNQIFIISLLIALVNSHGMLLEPPNRGSLWRFQEFQSVNPPINYSDNQVYCGGAGIQYGQNGGKCGVCGDDWSKPRPRDNESGGLYGKGIIARNYSSGQVIPITVDITADHAGTFEFRLCERNDVNVMEEDECFSHLLEFGDGTGYSREVRLEEYAAGFVNTTITLPNVKCSYCVLRWHYRTANSWGNCLNGTSAVGCGDQEIFRNCADVAIF